MEISMLFLRIAIVFERDIKISKFLRILPLNTRQGIRAVFKSDLLH